MYKLFKDFITNQNAGVILNGNTSIPFDESNTDYQQFLKDIKEGVELLDAEGNVVTDFVKELP